MTFLELFDSASANECYRRNETIVPQQALALANSPLAIEQSRLLTKRLIKELSVNGDMSDSRFVETLFQNVLCRLPSSDERETCLTFLQSQTEKLQQTKNLTTFSDGPKLNVLPSNDPHTRARENLAHVLLNHNDFVTVR